MKIIIDEFDNVEKSLNLCYESNVYFVEFYI